MTKITTELHDDLKKLEEAKNEAASNDNFMLARELHQTINTIKRRPLINYFSQKNLLPKYGFPVDVVDLEANFHIQEAKNVELNRDLQIAISEYAPESQVVANGKLVDQQVCKKVREKDLIRRRFYSCNCDILIQLFMLRKRMYLLSYMWWGKNIFGNLYDARIWFYN